MGFRSDLAQGSLLSAPEQFLFHNFHFDIEKDTSALQFEIKAV